jgi:ribosomal protein S3
MGNIMGQKVHPLGFRVGITKKYQSQWFARFQKYSYSQSVLEDHMLRKNLLNLFSNLQTTDTTKEGPQSKTAEKGGRAKKEAFSKITQIKIERALIPYEIGIQIHAADCLAITKAIDNLKLNKDLLSNLQKTRKYLFKISSQLQQGDSEQKLTHHLNLDETSFSNREVTSTLTTQISASSNPESQTKPKKRKLKKIHLREKTPLRGSLKKISFFKKSKAKFSGVKKRKKTSLVTVIRLRAIKKRFKKRQNLKKQYRKLIAKGLVMRKKGNLILRKVKIKSRRYTGKKTTLTSYAPKGVKTNFKMQNSLYTREGSAGSPDSSNSRQRLNSGAGPLSKSGGPLATRNTTASLIPTTKINSFTNRMYKKFASLFLNKMNKQFLVRLKSIMKYWHSQTNKTSQIKQLAAPLGYSRKWHAMKSYTLTHKLKALLNFSGTYQVEKLTKLIDVLERKSIVKMEALRKDFITFGTVSKTRAFGYYQLITFLKHLKELVSKLKKQTKQKSAATKVAKNIDTVAQRQGGSLQGPSLGNMDNFKAKIKNLIRAKSQKRTSITGKVLNKFKNLLTNNQDMVLETRKVKLISYLKNLVQKHRTENIFYYLATIAEARKDLKNLKRYIKQHANFLFGINVESMGAQGAGAPGSDGVTQALIQKVANVLTANNKFNSASDLISEQSTEGITGYQKAFLTFITNQRKMYNANLALTPKISIKFFSVKPTDLVEKASVVTDSIVDALEKRKPFRGVIKKAKEDLMDAKRVGKRVKGVKIQVSGRLNGAEIARSEWVRAGRVPLQTLRANIDYSYRTANTIYGIIGVKVWIFKGYSKLN